MNTAFKIAKAHFKLDFPKLMWLLMLMGGCMLAPHYPRFVVAMFFIMTVGSVLGSARETRSEELLLTMPVRRGDIVRGHALFIAGMQLAYLMSCAVFAVIAMFIPFFGTTIAAAQPGMVANIAFFGVAFAAYGMFNLAFLPLYYFNGGKVSPTSLFVACIVAILSAAVLYGLAELACAFVPSLAWIFYTFSPETVGWQLLALVIGIGLYVLLSFIGIKAALKRYEK